MIEMDFPEDHKDRPRRRKCCGKCAFRPGSQETEDGFGWANMVDGFQSGQPFYCHETVPGHHQEDPAAGERWQICGGWSAHEKTGFAGAMKVAFSAMSRARAAEALDPKEHLELPYD